MLFEWWILKVTFKQNPLKRNSPSELGYFNISDQNYTLINLSTKLLFENQGYANVIIEFTNPFVIWSCANLKYTFYWLPSVWNMSNVWNISTVWKQKNSNEKLKANLMELRLYKFMKQYFFKPSFINKNDKRFLALLSRHYVYKSTNKLSSGSQQRPKPRTWMYRYGPKFIICMIMPGMSNRLKSRS